MREIVALTPVFILLMSYIVGILYYLIFFKKKGDISRIKLPVPIEEELKRRKV